MPLLDERPAKIKLRRESADKTTGGFPLISAISSASAIPSGTNQVRQQPQPAASKTPEDSVHLSQQAKAASGGGDVDHDGDSH